jgi:hypothetical protein
MSEALEVQQVVDHLQGVLENLVTRGLASAESSDRKALATLRDEFVRIGASHLADRVGSLCEALETGDRDGPNRLLKTQASLRLFERVLTLEVARAALQQWQAAEDGDETVGEDVAEDDDESDSE